MAWLIFNVITVLHGGGGVTRVAMGDGEQGVALIALHFLVILFIVKVQSERIAL